MKKLTIYDIAKEAGVSSSMVSRVINHKGPVKKEKKELIESIIQKRGFEPNYMAQGLKGNYSKIIGCVVPNIIYNFYSKVFYSIQQTAQQYDYLIILCNSNDNFEQESKILQMLKEKKVDAIVFLGGRINEENAPIYLMEELYAIAQNIPVVIATENNRFPFIEIRPDERTGVKEALCYLKEKGHYNIGFVGAVPGFIPSQLRRQYFIEGMKLLALPLREEWILDFKQHVEDGLEIAHHIKNMREKPTAFICFNDEVALLLLHRFQKSGIQVPNDISIIGFDGIPDGAMSIPELTSVKCNYEKFGEIIFATLCRALNKESFPKKILLPMNIIERETVHLKNVSRQNRL